MLSDIAERKWHATYETCLYTKYKIGSDFSFVIVDDTRGEDTDIKKDLNSCLIKISHWGYLYTPFLNFEQNTQMK